MAVLSSSRARLGGVSPICANGGTVLCPSPRRRSGRGEQSKSGTLRRHQFSEICLLRVWRTARPATRMAGHRKKFLVRHLVATDVIRLVARPTPKTSACLAFRLALAALSPGLLRRVPARAIPASGRTGDHNSLSIRDYPGGNKGETQTVESLRSVNRVPRRRIPHIRLGCHQQQRTHALESLHVIETVKRSRVVIFRRGRVVRNLRTLHVFESVLFQKFDVLRPRPKS